MELIKLKKEPDLEKELKELIGNVGQIDRKIARHFYNLGLNTMYERIKGQNREEGHN